VVTTLRAEGRLVFEAPHHDDDLVTSAIVAADVIVSLDSGFVHLAYALTGALRNTRARANHVINFGLPGWNTPGASFWSLGGPTSIGVIDVTTSSGLEAGYVALRGAIAQCLGPTAGRSRSRPSKAMARHGGPGGGPLRSGPLAPFPRVRVSPEYAWAAYDNSGRPCMDDEPQFSTRST
jgi:hypothetical protein